jgi:CRP-like cAMP-binding protein
MRQIESNIGEMLEVVCKTSLFRHLSGAELEQLLALFETVEYEPGEVIVEEGSVSDQLYMVLDQAVAVEVNQDGRKVYICTIGPGEMFGEAGIFMHVARTADVVAHDGARLVRIGRSAFLAELKNRPRSGIKILFMMVYSLLRKLREVNQELAYERKDQGCQDEVDALIGDFVTGDHPEMAEELFSAV